MEQKDKIQEGDTVDVYLLNGEPLICVEVLSPAYDTGDCWKLKGLTGEIYYVQTFSHIIRSEGE